MFPLFTLKLNTTLSLDQHGRELRPPERLDRVGDHRQCFILDNDFVHRVFRYVTIFGDNDGYGLAHIVDFSLGQGGRSRSLQDRLHPFQPRARMNLKALGE